MSDTARKRLDFIKAQIHEACLGLVSKMPDMTQGELAMYLSGVVMTCDYLAKLDGHQWINAQLIGTAAAEYGQEYGMILGRLKDIELGTGQ